MSNIYWEEHGIGSSNPSDIGIQEFKLIASPTKVDKNVGGYNIQGNSDMVDSVMFLFKKKPSWFHRKCTRLFLGWVWIDLNN